MWPGLARWWPGRQPADVPDALWQGTLAAFPFLRLSAPEDQTLRQLARAFLHDKEFTGAHGLQVTDAMALAIAAQAVLPLVHLPAPGQARRSPRTRPAQVLRWYGDFVGIVVQPAAVLARRRQLDAAGVEHQYSEALAGEAMDGGPVMLSWPDVAAAGGRTEAGYNLVIHEFAHKLDLQDGSADGCPPLPLGFLGESSPAAARQRWLAVMEPAWRQLREQLNMAERFGGEPPWLDSYGATDIGEFFAVACEAYFVNRARLAQDFAPLVALLDAFFRPDL